jgi:hypothetical protein
MSIVVSAVLVITCLIVVVELAAATINQHRTIRMYKALCEIYMNRLEQITGGEENVQRRIERD